MTLPPEIPRLDGYRFHKAVQGIPAWNGTVMPQLRARFYRRSSGERVESMGVYADDVGPAFAAWGYVGEPHCRFNAVADEDGG